LADALHRWFEDVVQPEAKRHLQASIVTIESLSGYQCRSRYNDPGQRISQHAFANAIDITGFITAKGEHVAVLEHWNGSEERSVFLRGIHAGACEIFGTTLGPEANESHKNHFHLDMKDRRRPLCDFTPEQERERVQAAPRPPVDRATAKVPVRGAGMPSAPARASAPAPAVAAELEKQDLKLGNGEAPPAQHHRRRRHSFRHVRW
jgi:hypothetical protein